MSYHETRYAIFNLSDAHYLLSILTSVTLFLPDVIPLEQTEVREKAYSNKICYLLDKRKVTLRVNISCVAEVVHVSSGSQTPALVQLQDDYEWCSKFLLSMKH